ncbi:hypothetical protein NEUTE1DRAFT_113756 [Neurospora tetrasperma FGSC 2508]|uniref:Uncharacterized protein n=1 Tax=Neurospora tetrasperma (strain FGSC 2508 / ATCC MYA-4615 / P0657) TaxID=510951 RepID=F8N2Z5_NEUT8|nr:uncharacterized protein NEUTE1DRAFT_113756 [Neurospora tetrasperma FGSC 2508]EGO51709.1 hypothetical protein NEUTE1DRAFT_113756 [Neurospora tetrasperma FGSC 2508]EGZ78291.1 hypothetical protein NEUTE2DRAFT_54178 [Neurospora tetrasperma FGSC 2509]
MPPKRAANGAAPNQPAAQRQRLAPAAPPPSPPPCPPALAPRSPTIIPVEIKTQLVLAALTTHDDVCAFELFCSDWKICNRQREKPQLEEILRKLRVDVYTPSSQTLGVQAGQGEEQFYGELKSYFAGHSMRRTQCPLFGEGAHGFENKHCEKCGCVPFQKEVLMEGVGAWDTDWEGKLDPEARGWEGGVWTGRLRKGMGYRGNGRDGRRKEVEPWDQMVEEARTRGINAYMTSIRNTRMGRFLAREVKRERTLRSDRLVVLNQRATKWLGRFTQRGLGKRVRSGLEGMITWGDEMVGLLPFIEGFTERFDDNGYLRVATGAPASSAVAAAVKARPFNQVKKHLSPEPPNQEPWVLYRRIRHLMINSDPYLNLEVGIDFPRYGIIPPTEPPAATVLANMSGVRDRVYFEHMVPLYVDYQALTNLETLYLDLRHVTKRKFGTTQFQMEEVVQLARRLEGKNLRLLVIAGLRTGGAYWWGERELNIEEIEGFEIQNPADWRNVNWLLEFRGALRPGGKLILVDSYFNDFPWLRHWPWTNPLNADGPMPQGHVPMGGFPVFVNNFIDNEFDDNELDDNEDDDNEDDDLTEETSSEETSSEETSSGESSSGESI